MRALPFAFSALLALFALACARPSDAPPSRAPLVVAEGLPPLHGFWQSEGYGYQLEITADGELARSQVTALSCMPTWRARIVARDAASATYRRTDSRDLFVLRRDGSSPDRLRLHPTQTTTEIALRRIPAALPVCARPTPDTPLSNFDVFAATFAEQYPFFAEHGVDWPTVVARARSQVTASTKPLALFEILQGMIEPLQDAHTMLAAPTLEGFEDGRGYAGVHAGPGWVEPDAWDRVRALADRRLVGPPRTFCNKQIAFGMLPGDVGYLRLHGFADFVPDGSFEDGMIALEAALDSIFADAGRWRALVIDVRTNAGGADPYGLAVAARLTATEYVAYGKQARLDPKDPTRWTSEAPAVVQPSARPGFRGRVVLLTGPGTISAGECFTQAFLERRPTVERVGQSTQGVFSDVMLRVLPNGWTAGVPNERFVTRGRSYDVTGVPPTIEVPLYTPAELAAGRDAALETAMRRARAE